MKTFFVDTGYLIALEASDDQHHRAAVSHWRKLSKSLPPLVTTAYVFDELVTFFNNRGRHEKAVEVGGSLLASPSIELMQVGEDLFNDAWDFFRQHQDKSFSFTDCDSFVLMRKLRLTTALTFDHHFKQAGFETLPSK